NPAPGLPPPKTDLPSHAIWTGQDSTQTATTAGQVMVCTPIGGASGDPRQSWETHGRHRWGQVADPSATPGVGHRAGPPWHRHTAPSHLDPEAGQLRTASARDSHPSRQGTADAGAPSVGT